MATRKYKPDKNGYYSTLVWDGSYNKDGTKHRKQLRTKKSSKELERLVKELQDAVSENRFVRKSDITFYDYTKEWISIYKANGRLNTKRMYNYIADSHIKKLGDLKLADITRMHLFTLLNSTTDYNGNKIYMVMKQVIKSAIRDRLLPPSTLDDIFADTHAPKPRKPEKRVLTVDEKAALSKADFAPMDKAFVYIIYGCGLRRGEALALHTFDIDFKSNVISVNKVLVYDENQPVIEHTTKSVHSTRKVPMPAFLSSYLKEYVKLLPYQNLFYGQHNRYMSRTSYNKMWKRILKQLNYAMGGTDNLRLTSGLTAHIFRHNYCSNLCYQIPTISIKKVAELMGDTDKVVMDVYNHIIMEKEDATSAIEEAVGM